MKSELEQNKKENKIKNKFSMDEDDKVIINNVKAEVEKLRNKYELLTQQENDYIKKLKESKKLYNLDESLTQNSFNNNINKIKKKNNNINNEYFFDKNKRSISQPEKIENKKKIENKIDLVNINLNDEKKNEKKEKKINKSTNDIFYNNNDKSNNKENISKIIVVKKNE